MPPKKPAPKVQPQPPREAPPAEPTKRPSPVNDGDSSANEPKLTPRPPPNAASKKSPAAASPKSAASPPKSVPPPSKGKQPPQPVAGGKGKSKAPRGSLFQAFEQLVHIQPEEAKARIVILEEETIAIAALLEEEVLEHCVVSEWENRDVIQQAERAAFSHMSFEESTEIQRVMAALNAKKSAVQKRQSVSDPGLGARIARKKSRMDAELAAEEEKLSKQILISTDASKKAAKEDREKRLQLIQEVTDQLDLARSEEGMFLMKEGSGKKLESKKVTEKRKELESKRIALEQKLKKLEELEARCRERECQDKERQRRCSNLNVDMDVINGNKNILAKINNVAVQLKQDEHDEVLDESMFRQMVVQTGDQFYANLKTHEELEKKRSEEMKALHGPAQAPPPPPPKPQQRKKFVPSLDEKAEAKEHAVDEKALPPIRKPSVRQAPPPGATAAA